MTTIAEERLSCGVCGNESVHLVLNSTSSFGSPDLDLRPAEPQRSSISYTMHFCPSCGFCAPLLDAKDTPRIDIIQTIEYKEQLNQQSLP